MLENVPFNIDINDKVKKSGGFLGSLDSKDRAFAVERYKKFLHMCKVYPNKALAPTKEIDEMWHLHMLSPIQYMKDCNEFFGELLDHNGGFGKRDDEFETWQKYFRETEMLWDMEFGEKYIPENPSKTLEPMFKAAACHGNGISMPRV